MSTQKHTPGPWHVGLKPGPIVYSEHGEQVANLFEPLIDEKENKANARLIAAAPDLLAALKELCADKYLADPINAGRMKNARAAIAKAEA
jgi:hypothetical protein